MCRRISLGKRRGAAYRFAIMTSTAAPSASSSDASKGIALILASTVVFGVQDAITKHLAQDLAASQIVMVRFTAFALFILILVARKPGGVRRATAAKRPWLQIVRSLILVAEIGLFAYSIRTLGLAEIHSILAVFPLIATALSVPLLGERVGIRRWSAVFVGFLGVLVILRPGMGVFDVNALLALVCAFLYGLYNVLTRLVSTDGDSGDTTIFYTAVVGWVAVICVGPWFWTWPSAEMWFWLACLSTTGITGHWMLIKALEAAPASVLQPFNYGLLVCATIIGFLVFGNLPDFWTVVGACIVVGSGLYTIFRERRLKRPNRA